MKFRIPFLLPVLSACVLALMAAGCAASSDTTEEQETMQPAQDTTAVAAAPAGPSREELQQEIDALKTENIQLKEKLAQAESANRELLSKASDLEASIAAREQAARTAAAEPKATEKRSYEGVSSAEDIRAYESAVGMVRKNDFHGAIAKFESLLNTSIKEDYAPNCRHWMGLAYFGLKDYKAALEQFKEVFAFKYSTKKDDAQMMIAQCYEKMGEPKLAKAEYEKLVKTYPTSEYADRARRKARQL